MTERTKGKIVAARYRLEKPLGAGGMGEVWSAENTVTGKLVALKFLKPELAARSDVRARFLREARAACAVRHPNVVEIHDVVDVEGASPTMVMELLDGESLGSKLEREGALGLADTARILLPVTAALAAAHAAGIVHRDLKPDNIFLANRGDHVDVKVLDFGIAKLVDGDMSPKDGLTKTGSLLGTPYYMSPEQAFGEKDIDRRSDIWSLGIILYECLTGRRPTETENFGQIMKIITADGIPSIRTALPQLPLDVCALSDRMLARERAKRPSKMEEIAIVLAPHAGESITSGVMARTFDPLGNAATMQQPSLTPVSGRRLPMKKLPRGLILAGVLVGAGGLFAVSKVTGGDAPVEVAPSHSAYQEPSSYPPPTPSLLQPVFQAPDALLADVHVVHPPPSGIVVRPLVIADAAPAIPSTVRTGPKLIEDSPF